MDTVILFNLVALWVAVLLALWLLLRLIALPKAGKVDGSTRPVAGLEPAEIDALVGKPAPEFAAWTLDQRLASLEDYRGQEALFILLSTTCPHCRNVVPEIERVGEKLLRRGGKVALVFGESADTARTYYESLGLTLPILIAPKQTTTFTHDYNRAGGVPHFVALNRESIVIHEGVVNQRADAWRALVHEWQAYPMLAKSSALYRS